MKHTLLYIGIAALALTSCNDILDQAPDNRTEIDTPAKVKMLMTSAYPEATPAMLCELSSDNLIDNNVAVAATHLSPYYDFQAEAFKWENIVNYSSNSDDTPYQVWNEYYLGISVCNHAIEAIDKMLDENPSLATQLLPYKGEALVARAWMHFSLVNVFAMAYRNDELSQADLGIPYVTEPETVVRVDYDRPSVTEVYRLIEQDIIEGLPLINDSYYDLPKFHFNKNAALAFAARFYLYKRDYDKVIEYANKALGTNAADMLRRWSTINQNSIEGALKWYNDEQAPCNFLLQTTYSIMDRMLSACRFMYNDDKANDQLALAVTQWGTGPCWSGALPCYNGNVYVWGRGQDYGGWLFRVYEYFEYTDKIAGIGFVHMIYQPFSAEETLLCRAEANFFKGEYAACLSDLQAWAVSKQCTTELTEARINNFYSASRTGGYVYPLNSELMSPDFVVPEDRKAMLDCILHFRRIETVFEGLRWFDIKRYGIEIKHYYRDPGEESVHVDSLLWNDPRRALQIPQDVIAAGLIPNDRTTFTQQSATSTAIGTPTPMH